MDKPRIAGRAPLVTKLEAGEYFWCACGLSAKQPFCDGSHRGTTFVPRRLILEQETKVALCVCKRSDKSPHCDGAHKKLPPEPSA